MTPPQPSYRKIVGAGLIVLTIILWAFLILIGAPLIGRLPILVQALFYLIVGIAWIIPLKPLVRWSETGSFRPVPHSDDDGADRGGSGRRG